MSITKVIWRRPTDPPTRVQIGMLTIDVPDGETQRKGFETPHATNLTRIGYKHLKPKGQR